MGVDGPEEDASGPDWEEFEDHLHFLDFVYGRNRADITGYAIGRFFFGVEFACCGDYCCLVKASAHKILKSKLVYILGLSMHTKC